MGHGVTGDTMRIRVEAKNRLRQRLEEEKQRGAICSSHWFPKCSVALGPWVGTKQWKDVKEGSSV